MLHQSLVYRIPSQNGFLFIRVHEASFANSVKLNFITPPGEVHVVSAYLTTDNISVKLGTQRARLLEDATSSLETEHNTTHVSGRVLPRCIGSYA